MNPNLKESLREAKRLGFLVKSVRRTGEIRISKKGEKSVKVNRRRKSSPRQLISHLNNAKKRQERQDRHQKSDPEE